MPPSNGGLRFCLGIGMSGDADAADVVALADEAITRSGFDPSQISCIATIDGRHDHPALLALAAHFGASIVSFDAARLEMETPRLKNPSEALFARIGCHGVAEAAALAAAGKDANLVVEKMTGRRVTVAIAG